jgi:hypothetical protein
MTVKIITVASILMISLVQSFNLKLPTCLHLQVRSSGVVYSIYRFRRRFSFLSVRLDIDVYDELILNTFFQCHNIKCYDYLNI